MEPGRNHPCPCGSGRKFKRCCLLAAPATAPDELQWRRLRRALDGLPTRMLNFVAATYGYEAMDEAWHEFMGFDEAETEFDPGTPHMPVFGPWLLHHWAPDAEDTVVADAALHGVSPTRAFLARKGRQLEPVVRQYLQSCVEGCFSFHEVTRVDPGLSLDLRDIFTGEVRTVREQAASRVLERGQITYALPAEVDGLCMLEASAPVVIGPGCKIELIALRERIAMRSETLTCEVLKDWDIELRDAYVDIVEQILEPGVPELRTTDGERVASQKLVFDIDSAEEALQALKSLDFESLADAPQEEVERDAAGELLRATIVWKRPGNAVHAHWTNTILGTIEIGPGRMTADVNSDERADAFRVIVAERLGDRARYRVSRRTSLGLGGGDLPTQRSREIGEDEIVNSPEVQALIQEHFAQHYERWVDEPVPALGGITPLAAVQDPVGRQKVDALLLEFEQRSARMQQGPDPAVFRRLRERLGMG